MTEHSNAALVLAAQNGDESAFAALVELYYGMVHGLAYSKVGDWAIAEDVTQDVFLITWTNLHQLKHPEAFLMWLRRIARNAALNWVRTREYRRKLAERHTQEQPDVRYAADDPSGVAAREECLDQIGEALRSLSPKLREAMVLFYLEGQTASACAEALGINVDTMKKRLRLGRQKMADFYARRQVEDVEQLLPHRPRKKVEQVVAGLAVGPVLPDWGASIAGAGPSLWLHDLWHGASPRVIFETGGVGPVAKATAAAGGLVVAGLAAGAILLSEPPVAQMENGGAVTLRPQATMAAVAGASDSDIPTTERYMLVSDAFGGSFPPELEAGDRIVRVNGVPISASILEDPRGYFGGLPGTEVTVTVVRTHPGGTAQELTFALKRPYVPRATPQETAPQPEL